MAKRVEIIQSTNTEFPIRIVFFSHFGGIVDIFEVRKITPKYATMIAEWIKS